MDRRISKNAPGFTLIELLVVIAIIGLLSSVVFASLNGARVKARDARRLEDIKQVQSALELFYDKYGFYPHSAGCGASVPNTGWCNSVQSFSGGHWIRDNGGTTLGEFLSADPKDPRQGSTATFSADGNTYFYFSGAYGGDGQWYMIVFELENHGNALEGKDGVVAPDGHCFDYGGGVTNNGNPVCAIQSTIEGNGVITVGHK